MTDTKPVTHKELILDQFIRLLQQENITSEDVDRLEVIAHLLIESDKLVHEQVAFQQKREDDLTFEKEKLEKVEVITNNIMNTFQMYLSSYLGITPTKKEHQKSKLELMRHLKKSLTKEQMDVLGKLPDDIRYGIDSLLSSIDEYEVTHFIKNLSELIKGHDLEKLNVMLTEAKFNDDQLESIRELFI